MNTKKLYREINEARALLNKNPVNYITVRKYIKLWKSKDDIINMEIKHGGSKWKWNGGKFKLSDREFKRAKFLLESWNNIDEVTKIFWVSKSYFDYHIRKLDRF